MKVKVWLIACSGLFVCGCGGGSSAPGNPDASDLYDFSEETLPPDGTPCDDGDPCTHSDIYSGGACRGQPYTCASDFWMCAVMACDGRGGCFISSVEEGFCLIEGKCWQAGESAPNDLCRVCDPIIDPQSWTPLHCDDSNPCTNDSCEPQAGCVHEPAEAPCDDGDPCTVGDYCYDGHCEPGADKPKCEDDNPCTVDFCEPGKGCVSLLDPLTACDDHNVCTEESCDPEIGCVYTPADGPCDDGNACTVGDECVEGQCLAGLLEPDCDDDNECTEDTCLPSVGCVHIRVKGLCDDGFACTEADKCLGGQCVGKKTFACPYCKYHENSDAAKAFVLKLSSAGHPGHGLDLDQNPETCAPASDCSGGIDNELGLLAPFVNEALQAAVEAGLLMYVVEFEGLSFSGAPFKMHFLASDLDPSNADCNYQSEECKYYPLWEALDAACNPIVSFDNAILDGNKITAGGPGYVFALQASLVGGGRLEISLMNARFEATVSISDKGSIRTMEGLLGGAVDKQELLDAVGQLPPEFFPLDLAQILALLDQLVQDDLDTDKDGIKDAVSVAIVFRTIPADIVPR